MKITDRAGKCSDNVRAGSYYLPRSREKANQLRSLFKKYLLLKSLN